MKFRLLLLPCLLLSTLLQAQITGIWRGYFNSGYGYFKQQYKYEVQINELGNSATQKGVEGVTYSYHSTVFYGKANLQGIYDSKNKNITIKETKLVELKISDKSEPCLMTCYLDYRKDGSTEILEGAFTSVNANSKGDCGSGYVYLEKVEESLFRKEDFLLKKPKATSPLTKAKPPATTLQKKTAPAPTTQQKKTTTPSSTPQKKTTAPPPVAKKPQPQSVTPKNNEATTESKKPSTEQKKPAPAAPKEDTVATFVPPVTAPKENEIIHKTVPVPDVIRERENPLVKTIVTNSPQIHIELFDNGEIDGDTITVYHNNEVIAFKKGLTTKPVRIDIKADVINSHHEFVMVANNLGSIPPNTALMVITTGGKRYELFISSDEKKNAKVVIEYEMEGKESK